MVGLVSVRMRGSALQAKICNEQGDRYLNNYNKIHNEGYIIQWHHPDRKQSSVSVRITERSLGHRGLSWVKICTENMVQRQEASSSPRNPHVQENLTARTTQV